MCVFCVSATVYTTHPPNPPCTLVAGARCRPECAPHPHHLCAHTKPPRVQSSDGADAKISEAAAAEAAAEQAAAEEEERSISFDEYLAQKVWCLICAFSVPAPSPLCSTCAFAFPIARFSFVLIIVPYRQGHSLLSRSASLSELSSIYAYTALMCFVHTYLSRLRRANRRLPRRFGRLVRVMKATTTRKPRLS